VSRYLGRVQKEIIKSFLPVNNEKCIKILVINPVGRKSLETKILYWTLEK